MQKIKSRPTQTLFHIKEIERMKESCVICRAICGPTRFKIIALLRHYPKGLAVTQLAKMLHASLSRVSHQLRILKGHKLVEATSQNREKIYKLAEKYVTKHLP